MKEGFFDGAMYVQLEDGEIYTDEIILGGKRLIPGMYISKLGNKNNSKFEMRTGFYLKYVGYIVVLGSKTLLFSVNNNKVINYYVFDYIN